MPKKLQEKYQLVRESLASVEFLEMTCKELDRYIVRLVQEAVKRDGKGPYPPNSDNCVATALSMEALNCSL